MELELFRLAYIDPGTGSMLFSIIIGIAAALSFFVKDLWIKIKFSLSGGKTKEGLSRKIDFVIFGESPRYFSVFKPLCDEFERRAIPCEYWAASNSDPLLQLDYKYVRCLFIGEGNKAFAKLNLMNANICIATTPGLDVYQWKRSKMTEYYVHIFHAMGDVSLYRMFGLDYYNAVLSTGDFTEDKIRKLEVLRHLRKKEVRVVGSTYMDYLGERLSSSEEKNISEISILVAPTWGESGILSRYGDEILSALLETGYKIIIRPHPQSKVSEQSMLERLERKFPNGDQISWNYDVDNFDILNASSLMITDYSSVIFDFTLLFDKPILYADTKLDTAPYDAAWLDEPPWTFSVFPKLGLQLKQEDFPKMKQIIDQLLFDQSYLKSRQEVRDLVWQCRGKAASNIVDFLTEKLAELQIR